MISLQLDAELTRFLIQMQIYTKSPDKDRIFVIASWRARDAGNLEATFYKDDGTLLLLDWNTPEGLETIARSAEGWVYREYSRK